MNTIPCMGGWCVKREKCGHYHSTSQRKPNERLCEPGRQDAFQPIDTGIKRMPERQEQELSA